MADICCGVTEATAAAAVSEVSPRSARRRRMHLRRFRFDEPEPAERKRPRFEPSVSPPAAPPAVLTGGAAGGGRNDRMSSANVSSLSYRPRPEPAPASPSPKHGVTSVCGRRRDMEDAVAVHTGFAGGRFSYYGVFDGHGCSHVATSCKDRMHEILAEELGSNSPTTETDWTPVMERSFDRMDAVAVDHNAAPPSASCRCELQLPKCDHVGSTAVVAVVDADRVVVANCGDSRAILCRAGVPVALSVDHKPDRPDELERIEALGGRVIYWDGARVLGVLAMSRAIGDGYLKPFVISRPEVTVTERSGGDECLIIASDGLWDVVTPEMACDIVRMCLQSSRVEAACADAAMLLTKLALARQSADNVSVVVVDLRRS